MSLTPSRVEDGTLRYVAEDNIKVVSTKPGARLRYLAGRHFKRWDAQIGRFVSNIKEEYPDD